MPFLFSSSAVSWHSSSDERTNLMKFALFRVHLATEGADSLQPFLSLMSGSLQFLLLLLAAGAHIAGEDQQLGVPTAFELGTCDDVVAASVLAPDLCFRARRAMVDKTNKKKHVMVGEF